MKLTFRQINHQPSPSFTALVCQHIELLAQQIDIEEARIVVERRLEASPAFRVSAHLVTPGPDLRAEACDHTLRAALQKTIEQFEERLRDRSANRAQRLRSNQQEPASRRRATPRYGAHG